MALDNGYRLAEFLQVKNIEDYSAIIDYSFIWDNTPEGDDFWCQLDSDFECFYCQAYKDFESKMSYFKP